MRLREFSTGFCKGYLAIYRGKGKTENHMKKTMDGNIKNMRGCKDNP